MTDRTNLAAWTPTSGQSGWTYYPPFLSANREGNEVEITVRANEKERYFSGETASVRMPLSAFWHFCLEAVSTVVAVCPECASPQLDTLLDAKTRKLTGMYCHGCNSAFPLHVPAAGQP